jgi:hypothetical protein
MLEGDAGMETRGDERSLGDLFAQLSRETSTLVRQEVDLAKAEMAQKAREVGKDAGYMAAGGVIAHGGFLVLLATFVLILGIWLPMWAAALIVAVVVLVVGGLLAWQGKNRLAQTDIAPTQSINSIKEDVRWAKEQTTQPS